MAGPPAGQRPERARGVADIDGTALAAALRYATEALVRRAEALNAINVFPVPDGDTGTNMAVTMRAAVEEIGRLEAGAPVKAVAAAAARGTLLGAHGNSGIILSQILAGFVPPYGTLALGPSAVAGALDRARQAAYRAVSEPREGTILTAISAASHAARERASETGATAGDVLASAVVAAREAAARSPELLPVLREAGVVDAGAEGLCIVLDAMLRSLRGDDTFAGGELAAIDAGWLRARTHAHGDGQHSGYCTEFVVRGGALALESIRERLATFGESVVVAGDNEMVRAHVHTHAPDEALAYGRSLGVLTEQKSDDMDAQFPLGAAQRANERTAVAGAVIAIASGSGIERLMRSLRALVVSGQAKDPSADEIKDAIVASGASRVVVLPNSERAARACEEAASLVHASVRPDIDVRIVPTHSIPQAVAALVARNLELPFDENLDAMRQAARAVRVAEVRRAERPLQVEGRAVRSGQPIGIIDGVPAVAEETVEGAVRSCVARMLDGREASLVTLYAGEGEGAAAGEALAASLREAFAVDVEVIDAGQPDSAYAIGVE